MISSETQSASHACDGSLTEFAYTWLIYAKTDLTVVLVDSEGDETVLVVDSDYTVTGVGDKSGGTIVTTDTYASGNTLVIYRTMSFVQNTQFTTGGKFPAEVVEQALDKAVMMSLELKGITDNFTVNRAGDMIILLSGGKSLSWGSAAPTTGTWVQGDIRFNTGAAAGGTIGWVCTSGGTPGTWKTFGTIAS